jgi:alpha-tubulin suppressor-like RCC1 family protein
VAIAAGSYHVLALCSDGTLVGWGANSSAQIGDGSQTNHVAPFLVNTNSGVSVLYGKTVVGIATGNLHSLALCSDSSVAAWGRNGEGQLGNNSFDTGSRFPLAVNTNLGVSALYGKTATAVAAGAFQSYALCSDGTAVAWGENLGNGTTFLARAPVAVSTNFLGAGQRFLRICCGANSIHTPVLVAGPSGSAGVLTGPMKSTNGSVQFSFSNAAGGFFGVMATTNFALPLNSWTPVGDAVEISSGQFQFTDLKATNYPQRFYRMRTP